MKENVGVLLPVSSLPSRHGIGDFGKNAYALVNWLAKHHYKYWQILPLNPVGPGNSPYMSTCSEAIETRYISLDMLTKEGLLDNVPDFNKDAAVVDYYQVGEFKNHHLWVAFQNYKKKNQRAFNAFKKKHDWLEPFAVYILFHNRHAQRPWNEWDEEEIHYFDNNKTYQLSEFDLEQCEYIKFMQFVAYKQWFRLWRYAKKCGITVIADCPFYVGIDSVDCWLYKEQFLFDEKYNPTMVSGVPPDCFSEDGQLWGTPIFNFEKMKEDNYKFLVNRIGRLATTCDLLRLDHFRAWDTYCVIPAEDVNARRGRWEIGPRYDFFNALFEKYPNIGLIAEDLGDLFQGVHDLRDHYNLPGMFIMEFCIFDVNNHSHDRQIVYTGTHDNQTLWGWLLSLPEWNINFLKGKFPGKETMDELYEAVFNYTWNVPSLMTIFPLQDLLKLDDTARLNYPGTVGSPNWEWKLVNMDWMKTIKFGQ
jgi:4-alpha-glucanotransferase